jgi:butyrate kinase
VAKAIGEYSVALKGDVDGIILTGGVAYNKDFCDFVKDYVGWIADVHVVPGEAEMVALASGGLRVLNGEEEAKVYTADA